MNVEQAGEAQVNVQPAAAPQVKDESARAAQPLVGSLKDQDGWRLYRSRFVTEAGRVVDTANGGISHSEAKPGVVVTATWRARRTGSVQPRHRSPPNV